VPRPTAHRIAATALSGIAAAAVAASALAVLHIQRLPSAESVGLVWGLVPVAAGVVLAVAVWVTVADGDVPSDASDTQSPSSAVCPACGGAVQVTWRLCPHCGTSLPE
jgi:hypothetical protein